MCPPDVINAAPVAIINPRAKGAPEDGDRQGEIAAAIKQRCGGADVVWEDDAGSVAAHAKEAVARGAPLVIAGGGDGTVSAIATALAGTEATLGLLPLGTLNHFARDLGIPGDLTAALEVIAAGHVARVDVAEVNGRLFLNNSNLGLYPQTVALREQFREQGLAKWPAHFRAMIRALARYRRLTIRIRADGHDQVHVTPIVFVGNNRYAMQGLRLGTRGRIDRGELCLYLPHHRNPVRLVWFTLLAMLGREPAGEEFDYLFSDALEIGSSHAFLDVSIDGELARLAAPLRYRIRPRALRVVVPRKV